MEGNQKKMREALVAIKEVAERDMRLHVSMSESDKNSIRAWSNLFVLLADSALSSPPRNCDVGTAEEQSDRFMEYCNTRKDKPGKCRNCVFNESVNICAIEWAQMPYEAEEGGKK
jgi:hypothetical protein